MNKQSPALVIHNLTKQYDAKHGIFDIDLEVSRGEVFGFLGPNGAGKSTTINTVLDILRPDKGTVQILELDHHKQTKAVHSQIGYLSGDMETDPTLTGKQYLSYVAHLRGGAGSERIQSLVTRLKADVTTKIKHLSRGSKQKIGLIAALMHDPEILILDEPTSGLDPLIQAQFAAIIREHKTRGKTAFISSHVLSEVQSICDRVGFIRDGRLVDVSTLDALLQKAPRRVTAHFKDTVPEQKLKSLKGVHEARVDNSATTFLFDGNINQLIKLLGSHPLSSLQVAEADLEELFMSYYQGQTGDKS